MSKAQKVLASLPVVALTIHRTLLLQQLEKPSDLQQIHQFVNELRATDESLQYLDKVKTELHGATQEDIEAFAAAAGYQLKFDA